MPKQDELAFIKALSALQMTLATARRKKVPTVSAGRRSTTSGSGSRASKKIASKRKANELASSGDSTVPANRRPATGAGSVPLSATTIVTGEQAAASSRQPGPSGVGATYATLLATNATPSQPSGTLKPTAMDSVPSESGVSMETSNRRMSNDMSEPLSGMPDGTTSNAQVANACLPAGQLPNKTPIFISGVTDTRAFLAWLRASCPGGLMAQPKGEKLMVVSSTADGFRAAVSALRSLDGKDGVSFYTFTLPEDRCARILVKILGRGMPESVVREELESLNICVQGVTQLRSGSRDPDPATDRPPIPHFIVSVARGPEMSKVRSLTELYGLRVSVESYLVPKVPLQCKRCQRFGHTQRNCGYAPRCVACGDSHHSGGCYTPREQPVCCGCGGNHTASYRGCVKWKEAKAALAKQAPERSRKSVATAQPAAPKAQRADPSAEQKKLGEGWNHVVRGGRVVKATTNSPNNPHTNPPPHQNTKAPAKPTVTATTETARPKKPELKSTATPQRAPGKSKKKPVASVKTAAAKPTTPSLVVPTQNTTSPLDDISDLLVQLPLHACVELTRRLITSIPSLPTGSTRPRAVLKTVFLFVAEYGSTP